LHQSIKQNEQKRKFKYFIILLLYELIMKTFILILSLLTWTGMTLNLNGQEKKSEEKVADTIVHRGGKKTPVTIRRISNNMIYYREEGETENSEIERKLVEKVIHNTGRVEVFNPPTFEMITEDDWRHVIITEDPDDILQHLDELGEIEVTSPAGRNRRTTHRNAEIRLKKQAAAKGGTMVLVTNTRFRGGFGDVPSITMKGVAYGIMPH